MTKHSLVLLSRHTTVESCFDSLGRIKKDTPYKSSTRKAGCPMVDEFYNTIKFFSTDRFKVFRVTAWEYFIKSMPVTESVEAGLSQSSGQSRGHRIASAILGMISTYQNGELAAKVLSTVSSRSPFLARKIEKFSSSWYGEVIASERLRSWALTGAVYIGLNIVIPVGLAAFWVHRKNSEGVDK